MFIIMLCMFCIAYFGVPVSKMRFHKKLLFGFRSEREKKVISTLLLMPIKNICIKFVSC